MNSEFFLRAFEQGYVPLRPGAIIRKGDKFFCSDGESREADRLFYSHRVSAVMDYIGDTIEDSWIFRKLDVGINYETNPDPNLASYVVSIMWTWMNAKVKIRPITFTDVGIHPDGGFNTQELRPTKYLKSQWFSEQLPLP